MNKKPSNKKLSLDTSTLRNLSDTQLGGVAGGLIIFGSERCGSGVPGCSAKCYSEAHLTCR